ncbi:MAG: dihydroxyacetone kinase subunit L [Candidatus Celaenobacter polaris]|nr:dihydroxyacetone kinase subunit L [Candidatus Celaenobacter polaris]
MASKMESCADELNSLDNQIGDGDIGITMVTGFRAMLEVSAELPDDIGMALMKCAHAFTGTRASSFATLFATGIMAAAKEVQGKKEVAWQYLPQILEHSIEKMAQRGKSKLGDKTVLDELAAIQKALVGIEDPNALLETADRAAAKALDEFRELPCKQGRARIYGNKTVGINDPGMVVVRELVKGLKEVHE